nr:SAM-dependent methyltransferase [Verrucomicrobiota bacterium]
QGVHHGRLCADILHALREAAPDCFSAVRYLLVEPFARLRREQSRTLRPYAASVEWRDSVEALEPFTGVQLSNELIDAFPVHLIEGNGEVWQERYVGYERAGFVFTTGLLSSGALEARVSLIPRPLPPGYRTEVSLAALAWPRTLATTLRRGYLLAFDYGYSRADYYAPERRHGTLSACSKHRREPDPLARPGEIDLSAHVDFTSLVEAAEQAGFRLAGFTDQHHFMVGVGRLSFADRTELTPAHEQELRAFKMLMHPGLMGLSFKVLCLDKGLGSGSAPAGFSLAGDPRRALGL